jgi:hypothetical protein
MIRVIFPTRLGLLARPLAADEHADLRIQDPQGRVMEENSFRPHRVWLRSYGDTVVKRSQCSNFAAGRC